MRALTRTALALAAFSAVLWGVSLFRITCRTSGGTLSLFAGEFSVTTMPTYALSGLHAHGLTLRNHRWWPRGDGLFWSYPGMPNQWVLTIPLWLPTALSAAAGLPLHLAHRRRVRRRAATHCPTCGYPRDAARPGPCPECGTASESL